MDKPGEKKPESKQTPAEITDDGVKEFGALMGKEFEKVKTRAEKARTYH